MAGEQKSGGSFARVPGRTYYTYKTGVPLAKGQALRFSAGLGYYAGPASAVAAAASKGPVRPPDTQPGYVPTKKPVFDIRPSTSTAGSLPPQVRPSYKPLSRDDIAKAKPLPGYRPTPTKLPKNWTKKGRMY